MSLIACGSIHEGHEWFCRFANEGAEILIKSYFMRSFFFSVFSSDEVLAKLLTFGVNC